MTKMTEWTKFPHGKPEGLCLFVSLCKTFPRLPWQSFLLAAYTALMLLALPSAWTLDEARDGLRRLVTHQDIGAEAFAEAMQEFGENSAQGYIRSAGKCLGDGVDHGIDRVQDSLAALKATPVDSTAANIVAANLAPEFASMKEFHAMRNLDPAQLTDAQKTAMERIRNIFGTSPASGTRCQRVMKLDNLQLNLDNPSKRIETFFTTVDDVSDLDTVAKIREGMRLDYAGDGFIDVDEIMIIEFDMPPSAVSHIPVENVNYPGTGNGFTGTRIGKVIPEYRFEPATQNIPVGINVPEGSKLYWLDPQGNKVLFGTFTNGGWQ